MKRLIVLAVILFVGSVRAEESMAYVIKVTPTLAYVDVGRNTGIMVGETYLILREKGGRYTEVGAVQLVRVDDSFSIGEIVSVAEGEAIEVLHRVVLQADWETISASDGASSSASTVGRRSFQVFSGADWGRNADLVFATPANSLIDAKSGTGWGVGLRLGQVFADQWRINLTYRMGTGADVVQLAMESDLHLVPRGYDRAGPYFGIGVGMHQLSWDSPGNAKDSTNKGSFNLVAGIQAPRMMNMVLELGYQKVVSFDDWLDLSNVRTYLGFGRHF